MSLFTAATLTDGPTTRNAAYWFTTFVKPLSDAVMQVLGQADWTTLPLLSGWTEYGAPYAPAEFRTFDKRVQLRGLVVGGLGGAGNPICYLPGLDPTAQSLVPGIANAAACSLGVSPNVNGGELYVVNYIAGGNNTFVSLDGVSYWLD